MNDEPTQQQLEWVKAAREIKKRLFQDIKLMRKMEPEVVKNFVEACQAALILEQDSLTFDKEIDLRNSRLFSSDD